VAGLEGSRVGEIVEQVLHYEGEVAVHDVILRYICSLLTVFMINTVVLGGVLSLNMIQTQQSLEQIIQHNPNPGLTFTIHT